MIPSVQDDVLEYYEYLLVYVDDLLALSMTEIEVLQEIQGALKFNNDNIENTINYLDARLKQNL